MNSKLSPISELNGIIPSLHTPFNNNKSIDYKGLEKLVLHTIDTNCAGMLLTAVAGETQNLTFNEKAEMMEFVLDISRNIIPIIFGCSSKKIEEIYSLVDLARQKKIKWVLIQAPLNLSEGDLIAFYKKINKIGPSHLMIQDLSWDGYGLSDSIIQNLINEVSNFKSLKVEVVNSGKKYSNIINLTKNNMRKCMVETRNQIKGNYKGYVYCTGLEEANNVLKQINQEIKEANLREFKIVIKHGCSEFYKSYPEYEKINFNGEQVMKYDESWSVKERLIDERVHKRNIRDKKIWGTYVRGLNLSDVLIINNWINYADIISDYSYKKIFEKTIKPNFLNKVLENQIEFRKNNF